MPSPNANETPQLSWRDWLAFLSPAGQQQIVDFVVQARDSRGENWLPEIKAEFPMAAWIAELVCSHDADAAFEQFAAAYPDFPIWMVKRHLIGLHAKLRFEIERPR